MPQFSKQLRQTRANTVLKELKKLYPNPQTILEFSNNWELLIAVLMSAQTTDKQVNVVTRTLFKTYPTFSDYLSTSLEQFTQDISGVNYYKTKAKHILQTAQLIHEQHNNKLPKTFDDMLKLPGVGRKTAIVVLGNAFNITAGIAVDTHVNRLAQKFLLTKHTDTKKIELDLQEVLPKNEWFNFTNRIIDYGREHSPARLKKRTDPICTLIDQM